TDHEFFEACRQLSLIVGDRDVTPLLAKLYAEHVIAAKEDKKDRDLPKNIPELMLSYLNHISHASPNGFDDVTIHRAAKVFAWECVRNGLKPGTASREEALVAFGDEERGAKILTHFESTLRIIQLVGIAGDRFRFSLDPLAEYLAGWNLVDEYGDKQE